MKKKTEQQLQLISNTTHWCINYCKHLIILTHMSKAIPTEKTHYSIIPCDMFCSKGQNINSPKRKTTPCKYGELIDDQTITK